MTVGMERWGLRHKKEMKGVDAMEAVGGERAGERQAVPLPLPLLQCVPCGVVVLLSESSEMRGRQGG